MAKTCQKKLRQRRSNEDINGNKFQCNNRNERFQQSSRKNSKIGLEGQGTGQSAEPSHLKKSSKCVGYLCIFVVLFTALFHSQLGSILHQVLQDSLSLNKFYYTPPNAHEDQQRPNSNQSPSAPSAKSHSRVAKTTGTVKNHDLPKELKDFHTAVHNQLDMREIVVDGRRITPREIPHTKPNNSSVRVYVLENFLSARECEGLVAAHEMHVSERQDFQPILCFDSFDTLRRHLVDVHRDHIAVSVNDFVEGTMCLNASFSADLQMWLQSNWSYSTAFYPGESPFSHTFTDRVFRATGLAPHHGGKFQLTSYPQGIGYKSHTDCLIESGDLRDRFATVLVYLRDVQKGGETQFPELGISVKPRAGNALVWNNMDSNGVCDPLSVHKANVVNSGHKYIIQRWYYYQNFYALGKRVDEPQLPTRERLTPRVSCDEYEQGSCRWYDEWNYEHIIQYNDIRHSLH